MSDERLSSFVSRAISLKEEIKSINDSYKDLILEVKNAGYPAKEFRKVISRKMRNLSDVEEEDSNIEMLENALE